MTTLLKSEGFRNLVTRLIEGQLMFAGFLSTIVVFGHKFSYEAKQSIKKLSIFEVGKVPQPVFHILVYDLAYINVPC